MQKDSSLVFIGLSVRLRRWLERRITVMADSLRRPPPEWPDVALMLVSVGLSLLLAEVGLRAYQSWRFSRELARMAQEYAPEAIHAGLGQLGPGARMSDLPNVVYELRPNLRGTYDGRRFRSDRYGFREDREIQLEKPVGVQRILGIGDSWMWGSGVDNGETYLDRLQELLSEEGRKVEVINTGVWGYNARQQVATLRWKGLLFKPDVVVIGLCGNDRLPPPLRNEKGFVDFSRSLLWNEVSGRLRRVEGLPPKATLPPDEPMPYREFLAAYAELFELAKKGALPVVVFSECFGKGSPPGQHRSCTLGSPVEWTDFLAHLDAWGFHRCPWNIDEIPQNYPDWGHATSEGNRTLASVLGACVRPLLDHATHEAH